MRGRAFAFVVALCAILAYLHCRYCRILRAVFEDTACVLLDPHANDPDTWRVPRVIYRTHSDRESADHFRRAWDATQASNPSFRQVLLTDDDVSRFMRENFAGRVNDAFERLNPAYGSARADMYRYCQMYLTGGVYLDIKSSCGDLRTVIHPRDGMLLGTEYESTVLKWTALPVWSRVGGHPDYRELQQFYIIAAPRHPLLRAVIDEVVRNIETYDDAQYVDSPLAGLCAFLNPAYHKVLNTTGPFAFTRAILRSIREENVRDYRLLCPHANGVIRYSGGEVNHKRVGRRRHYSRARGPLVSR